LQIGETTELYEYEANHARYYDLDSAGTPGDLGFYVEEANKSGSPVLELGCGTGRILIPTAQAGIDIIGVDASSAMLDVARAKIGKLDPSTQARIELVEGDMRTFSLERKFRLVTIPYRAFLHVLTPEDQRATLERIRRRLTDDGRLILNIFDLRFHTVAEHATTIGAALKKQNEFTDTDTGHRIVVWETRKYDPESQVISEDRIFEEIGENGKVLSRVYSPLTLCWIYRREMQYLLELSGFKVEALYGDFNRGPFRYGGEQVWIASKLT
jgi:ubiquinone/menaquinone biosynthesis C-methylase UbiE